eukprot:EC825692.1.p3 GENE.EC825692.1~~EC825692.1.p3  ORF type:complete len:59 (-),score=8.89 EC825692.1:368-544(-)
MVDCSQSTIQDGEFHDWEDIDLDILKGNIWKKYRSKCSVVENFLEKDYLLPFLHGRIL